MIDSKKISGDMPNPVLLLTATDLILTKWLAHRRQRYKTKKADFWTHAEVLRMLALTRGRNYIAIGLGYFLALRISEVRSLRVSDLDFRRKCVWVYGKGSKRLPVYFYKDAVPFLEDLKKWVAGQPPTAFVIPGRQKDGRLGDWMLGKILKKFAMLANISFANRSHWHMLRHSRATRIYELTGNISYASSTLRHSETAVTERVYLHLPPRNLRTTVNKLMTEDEADE